MKMKGEFAIMVNIKPLVTVLVLGLAAVSMAVGQTNTDREMSVEEYYLQESNEVRIIKEQARGDSVEDKELALDFIIDAIKRGNDQEEIRATLENLGTEGTVSISRENGRLVNNNPQIRIRAVQYLGELGTPEAKDALLRIVKADNESSVLVEAFRSLAKIGINENDETVKEISFIVHRYNNLAANKPDERLIFNALEAYEQLAETSGGIKDPTTLDVIREIQTGPYQRIVRERARKLMESLFRSGGRAQARNQQANQ
jgi:HEAT repeat protein